MRVEGGIARDRRRRVVPNPGHAGTDRTRNDPPRAQARDAASAPARVAGAGEPVRVVAAAVIDGVVEMEGMRGATAP
jgi:hypothetical protein